MRTSFLPFLLLIALFFSVTILAISHGEATTSPDITELTQEQSASAEQSVRPPFFAMSLIQTRETSVARIPFLGLRFIKVKSMSYF